ncbi:class I SAM-dependent RNA methyltransferase [Nitrospirota bacterium]
MKTSPIAHKKPIGRQLSIHITCPGSITPLLEKEVRDLGLEPEDKPESKDQSTIVLQGSMEDVMRLNMTLRTANSVLVELMSFRAPDADALYRQALSYPWEKMIEPSGYVCITSNVNNPTIRDTRIASLKFKDALVDRIKSKCGKRPNSGPDRRGTVIHLLWRGDQCKAFLDTSGESLSKRGYRKVPGTAPLKEGLAAALVLSTGWSGEGAFVNPMCGSGTLAIEAALLALNKAPGLLRSNYGFMHIKGFDRQVWDSLRKEAASRAIKKIPGRIIASDMDPKAVEAARKNARTAGVEHLIEFAVSDFQSTEVPGGQGVVIINPPYGERLGHESELENLYALMGDFMKQQCKGKRGYIFTGNPSLSKKIGLRTKSRRQFHNGPIECRLLEYELYEGTRKNPRDANTA